MKTIAMGGKANPEDHALIEEIAGALVPDDQRLGAWLKDYAAGQGPRIAQELGLVASWLQPATTLLEIGCTPPLLTLALRRRDYAVTAVDLRPERFGSALRTAGVPYVRCDIETERLPFDEGTFDAILFNEVFEHLRINIPRTLVELRRVLKPGGLLFLSTPNLLSFGNWLTLVRSGRLGPPISSEYAKLETIGHMGHVRVYTVWEVIDALEAAGFRPAALVFRHPLASSKQYLRAMISRFAIRVLPKFSHTFSLICRQS
jgi:SAM-dependent methyltransferase